jgi:hypothetical protein
MGPNHNFTPHASTSTRTTSFVPSTISTVGRASIGPTTQDVENDIYRNMNDDGSVIDEETINWPVLLTRVSAFFLLFLMIIFCSLEEVSQKFLWLGAIVCVILILVLISTFVDLRPYLCFCCPDRCSNNYFVTRRSIIIRNQKPSSANNSINSTLRGSNRNSLNESKLVPNAVVMQYSGNSAKKSASGSPFCHTKFRFGVQRQ